MSTSQVFETIDYPESDGQPIGETDLHRDWMIRILDILRYRYRGQAVYVASNLLLYYEEGRPTRYVVPDNFVVLDSDPSRRRTFKTWEEGKVPDVVFEVTSEDTEKADLVTKPGIFEQIGVKEYFLYDPSGAYLKDFSLQGFRLVEGVLTRILPRAGGILDCQSLNIELSLDEEHLVMTDATTGHVLLCEAEAERQAKEAERLAKEAAEEQVRQLLAELERLKQGK